MRGKGEGQCVYVTVICTVILTSPTHGKMLGSVQLIVGDLSQVSIIL